MNAPIKTIVPIIEYESAIADIYKAARGLNTICLEYEKREAATAKRIAELEATLSGMTTTDACILCGRKINDVFMVDDLFKLSYGLCLTCSAKPDSHGMACDVISRRLPQATVMSRNA